MQQLPRPPQQAQLTAAAKKGNGTAAAAEFKVKAAANVKAVEAGLPKAAVDAVANSNIDAFTVSTPIAAITFDSKALDTIAGEATADVKISAAKVDTDTLNQEIKQVVGDRPVFNFSVTSGETTMSQFGGNVTVSVPYTPKVDEDINAIVIYYINAEGKLEMVSNCKYDPATGSITFTTNHFSQYAVGYNKVSFKDVAEDAWYGKAVGFIGARGITTGTGNGNYSPEAKLTRGEFFVMMMRAYGMALDKNPADNFKDAGSTYYTGYLATAKRLGITGGLPEGIGEKQLTDYKDADRIESWAKDAMTIFVERGIIRGSSGKLTPAGSTTRAEMAQILYNLMSK